ncbi:hypothetical protein QL285_015415 [Trifolium repens]|nr:hypothetical protein QL285_015415 [Trifolium repens]
MPSNHKKKWHICDDVGDSLRRYVETMSWFRVMSTYDGTMFEDIPNSHCAESSYPLVEIEIIFGEKLVKILIHKSNLYVIAFCTDRNVRFQFNNPDLKLDDSFTLLKFYNGVYTHQPWNNLGPERLVATITDLYDIVQADLKSSSAMKSHNMLCEIFFFYLSEAARNYVIETIICETLTKEKPVDAVTCFPSYGEEKNLIFKDQNGPIVKESEDIYTVVKGKETNPHFYMKAPNYVSLLVHSYKALCKPWYVYSLSGKKEFEMNHKKAKQLNVRSVKTLRSIIGILGCTNLVRIVNEWKSKNEKSQVADEMEKRVVELQNQKKSSNISRM